MWPKIMDTLSLVDSLTLKCNYQNTPVSILRHFKLERGHEKKAHHHVNMKYQFIICQSEFDVLYRLSHAYIPCILCVLFKLAIVESNLVSGTG